MLTLPAPTDFNFRATVTSHGWYRLAPFRWNDKSATLRRAEASGDDDAVDLTIRCSRRSISVEGGDAVDASRIRRMLQLDLDLGPFHEMCARAETHRSVAETRFGRLLCGTTMFEDVVKIIATTNTTWSQTVRMVSLLTDRAGARAPSGEAAFPTPANIAKLSPDILKNDCRFGYRSAYVHKLAEEVASGRIVLESLAADAASSEEVLKRYRTLPGVGPYAAAHMLAMDGRHDYIAVDTEFRRFVREKYHGGRMVSDKTMLRRYARWGRWKYLAYWSELWMS